MRLNKFLAKAGIASRRKSDELIQMATTMVNGKVCLDPAYHVKKEDSVQFDGKKVMVEKKKIVLMFHKPKKVIRIAIAKNLCPSLWIFGKMLLIILLNLIIFYIYV